MIVKNYLHCLAFLTIASVAHVESEGKWSARLGVVQVAPAVSSGNLSAPSIPGSKVDLSSDTQLAGGLNYRINEHFSLDLPMAFPLNLNIDGDGSLKGIGKLGQVRVLPFTALGQYRFFTPASSKWTPYEINGLSCFLAKKSRIPANPHEVLAFLNRLKPLAKE